MSDGATESYRCNGKPANITNFISHEIDNGILITVFRGCPWGQTDGYRIFIRIGKRYYGITSSMGDHSALGKMLLTTLDTRFTEKLTEIITVKAYCQIMSNHPIIESKSVR